MHTAVSLLHQPQSKCATFCSSLLHLAERQQQLHSDDTLVINRGSLLKTALGGAAAAAARDHHGQQGLLKPRRLGVLGKAQRVVAGSAGRPPLAPPSALLSNDASEDGTAAPASATTSATASAATADTALEANRKRKADAEACQSPKQLLSVGEGKRRQSPAADEVRKANHAFSYVLMLLPALSFCLCCLHA